MKKSEVNKGRIKNKKRQTSEEKSKVILDRKIDNFADDFIGVNEHVQTIKSAIDGGAEIISLSSGYGGGKSSLCNILSKDKTFNKVSVVSLWDVIIDKDNKEKKAQKEEFNILSLYKSFLYQMAGSFHSSRYSNYINKALNKTTTFFNIYSKTRSFIFCAILFVIFALTYALSLGIEFKYELTIFDTFDLTLNQNILSYLSLFVMGLTIFWMIINGKVLYTSWKTEKDRLITSDDVTTLYVDLINDSIHKNLPWQKYKKNLVIIEDVDRCIDDKTITDENVLTFLKGILKLKHYTCKNYFLRKKLKSVIFIIAINEGKIYDSEFERKDELLKLFDYRLDLGKIHNEDFEYILDELLKKVSIPLPYTNKIFKVILKSKNNSIRLLKCVINDALLKYNSLCNKFKSKGATIRLESCIAYSYLKNNYFTNFDWFLNNDDVAVEMINDTLNKVKQKKDIFTKENINSFIQNLNRNNTSESFVKELFFFIKNNYIDEDFKQYFYNYPKGEKYTTIQESKLREYLFNEGNLDIENNKNVSKIYIFKLKEKMNDLKLNYPLDILEDSYLSEQLFSNVNDNCLSIFLSNNLKLDSIENQKKSIQALKKIFNLNVPKENIKLYLICNYSSNWTSNKILADSNEYYELRYLLVEFFKEDIIEFKNLFMNNATSISYNEFSLIKNKNKISQIINMTNFSEDLEKIFPELIGVNTIEEHIIFAKYWYKNLNNHYLFAKYISDLLLYHNKYNYELLKLLRPHYSLILEDKKLNNYFNSIIEKLNADELKKLNELKYFINLDENNLLKFNNNKLALTPLISLLYYERFGEIIKYSIDESIFSTLSLNNEYDYLSNGIKKFKEYLLTLDYNSKYDLLFSTKFEEKYPITINWTFVKNIHLLFINNYSMIDNIIGNIRTNSLDFDQICYYLDEIQKMSTSYNDSKVNLVLTILNKYHNIIKQNINMFDNKFDVIISKINNFSKVAKLYIYYQVELKIFVSKYSDKIREYGTNEDKTKYAEFINSLENPSIDGVLAVDIVYPFNEKCIKLLYDNKYYEKTIKSSILADNCTMIRESINNLQPSALYNVYQEDQKYKEKLINNDIFLNKIKSGGYTNNISVNDIIDSLNKNMTIPLLCFVIDNYNDSIIIKILSSLESIPERLGGDFVSLIAKKQEIFKHNINLAYYLRNLLTKNSKRKFTINIIKNVEKVTSC